MSETRELVYVEIRDDIGRLEQRERTSGLSRVTFVNPCHIHRPSTSSPSRVSNRLENPSVYRFQCKHLSRTNPPRPRPRASRLEKSPYAPIRLDSIVLRELSEAVSISSMTGDCSVCCLEQPKPYIRSRSLSPWGLMHRVL
jgi:hypothetical protein